MELRAKHRAALAWWTCAGLLGVAGLCAGGVVAGGAPAGSHRVKLESHKVTVTAAAIDEAPRRAARGAVPTTVPEVTTMPSTTTPTT